jgi:hypothetical protein
MKMGSSCVSGKYPDGTKKVKPTARVKETASQYAERKAMKPLNVTPVYGRITDGLPEGTTSGLVTAKQRQIYLKNIKDRPKIEKELATLRANADNLEKRAAQSKANREGDNFQKPSGIYGVGRTNTTMGAYSKIGKKNICTSQGGSKLRTNEKGSSGIMAGDGTKPKPKAKASNTVKETESQYAERKAMKPLDLSSRQEKMSDSPFKEPDMMPLMDKKMKDHLANQAHIGKMLMRSLRNRQRIPKKVYSFGTSNDDIKRANKTRGRIRFGE